MPAPQPAPRHSSPLPLTGAALNDVIYSLHDCQFSFDGTKLHVTENGKGGEFTNVNFGSGARTSSTFDLHIKVCDAKTNSAFYSLEDLELRVVRVAAGETPLISGTLSGNTKLVFQGLETGVNYIFHFEDGSFKALKRPSTPKLALSASV